MRIRTFGRQQQREIYKKVNCKQGTSVQNAWGKTLLVAFAAFFVHFVKYILTPTYFKDNIKLLSLLQLYCATIHTTSLISTEKSYFYVLKGIMIPYSTRNDNVNKNVVEAIFSKQKISVQQWFGFTSF